jgi:branched-chain amino acid transport system substrate-binding protein
MRRFTCPRRAYLARAAARPLLLGALLLLVPGVASCSLNLFDRTSCKLDADCVSSLGAGHVCVEDGFCRKADGACSDNAGCRAQFGFGFVCGEGGVCGKAQPLNRCTKTFPDNLFESTTLGDAIVIGNLMDRSVETQKARENSAQLAVAQANAAGGLEGRLFAQVFCTVEPNTEYDELARADAAVASAEWLVGTLGVPAIVGPSASGDASAVFAAIRETQTLLISPSATSPALTGEDNTMPSDESPGFLWRTAPPDSIQGKVIAEDLRARDVSTVEVVYQIGAYGEELSRVFQEEFAKLGGTSDGSPSVYTDATEIGPIASSIADSSADTVLFISSQAGDVEAFLDAASVAALLPKYQAKGIFLTDAAANADVLTKAEPDLFPNVRGTRPAKSTGPVNSAFSGAYASAFDGVDVSQFSFTAHAFDASWLVLYGSAWSHLQLGGEVSGLGIARGLRRISAGEKVEVGGSKYKTVIQAFRGGGSVDVVGASGELDYDPATEETTAPIEVWRIDTCVQPPVIASLEVGEIPEDCQ